MANLITWEKVFSTIDKSNIVTLVIKELDNDVETGVQHSARLNKDHPEFEAEMKALLKGKIILARAKEKVESAATIEVTKMDFSNFEDYVKGEV